MANSIAVQRLMREKKKMEQNPDSTFIAIPTENNLFEWHFVLYNFADDSPYKGGQYHGIINIPSDYPLKPPSMKFITPNGRFSVGEKICLSFTNYHPETWSSSWTISSMLIGVISFMHTNENTVGGVTSSEQQRKSLAIRSINHNLNNKEFVKNFEQYFDRLGLSNKKILNNNQPIDNNEIVINQPDNEINLLPRQQQNNQRIKYLILFIFTLAILLLLIYIVTSV